jgi:hypothetical protein
VTAPSTGAAPASFNLADLFRVVAGAIPDHEAVVDGARRLTYATLDDRVRRLATVLAAQGVGPGDHVGLHLHNGSEYLEGMLASYLLRAVPVNVNYRYVADELRYLFEDADLVVLLHEPAFTPVVEEVRGDVPALRFTLTRGEAYEEALAAADPLDPSSVEGRSGDDHYVLYTGGTRTSSSPPSAAAGNRRSPRPRSWPSGPSTVACGSSPPARSCTAAPTGWPSPRCSAAGPWSSTASPASTRGGRGSSWPTSGSRRSSSSGTRSPDRSSTPSPPSRDGGIWPR